MCLSYYKTNQKKIFFAYVDDLIEKIIIHFIFGLYHLAIAKFLN